MNKYTHMLPTYCEESEDNHARAHHVGICILQGKITHNISVLNILTVVWKLDDWESAQAILAVFAKMLNTDLIRICKIFAEWNNIFFLTSKEKCRTIQITPSIVTKRS